MSPDVVHDHYDGAPDLPAPVTTPQRSLLNSGGTASRELWFAARPDQLSLTQAESIYRNLARYRPDDGGAVDLLATAREKADATEDFLAYFNIGDPATYDPTRRWGKASGRDRLRIPLGRTLGGVYIHDFKQGPEGGCGPHGSMVAFTGGGKSEALRSLVVAFGVEHSPDEVQFILGDFKGAATFTPVEGLPHVHGVVSNLEDSADLLNRFVDAVMGELTYRQELLKTHGFDGAREWNMKRNKDITRTGTSELEPMPALFVIIDEFGEATTLRPDLIDLFVSFNRVGRSLWMHALYASQHADSGRLEKVEANLGYRMAGKVTSGQRSREALGHGVAGAEKAFTDLKNAPPGSFFAAVDGELVPRFRFWYTSSPYVPADPNASTQHTEPTEEPVEPHRFTVAVAALPAVEVPNRNDDDETADQPAAENEPDHADQPAVCKVLCDQIGRARPKNFHRQLWLPPLKDTPAVGIDELLQDHTGHPWQPDDTLDGGLIVPIARVDEAYRAAQYPQLVDLAGAGGHVGIVGAPQSGKFTTVQSLAMGLAMTHSPQRVQIYGIDLGGGLLPALSGLPHVGLLTTSDTNRMRRIMETVSTVLDTRRRSFEEANSGDNDSFTIRDYRARKFGDAEGNYPDDGFGDVFLIIDGLTALKTRHEDLHAKVVSMIQEGLSYGVHLIYTNDKWTTVNHEINSKTDSRLELRLLDRAESKMTPHGAARPTTTPCRPSQAAACVQAAYTPCRRSHTPSTPTPQLRSPPLLPNGPITPPPTRRACCPTRSITLHWNARKARPPLVPASNTPPSRSTLTQATTSSSLATASPERAPPWSPSRPQSAKPTPTPVSSSPTINATWPQCKASQDTSPTTRTSENYLRRSPESARNSNHASSAPPKNGPSAPSTENTCSC